MFLRWCRWGVYTVLYDSGLEYRIVVAIYNEQIKTFYGKSLSWAWIRHFPSRAGAARRPSPFFLYIYTPQKPSFNDKWSTSCRWRFLSWVQRTGSAIICPIHKPAPHWLLVGYWCLTSLTIAGMISDNRSAPPRKIPFTNPEKPSYWCQQCAHKYYGLVGLGLGLRRWLGFTFRVSVRFRVTVTLTVSLV